MRVSGRFQNLRVWRFCGDFENHVVTIGFTISHQFYPGRNQMTPDEFLLLHLDAEPSATADGQTLTRRYHAATGTRHTFADVPGHRLTAIRFECALLRLSPAWTMLALSLRRGGASSEDVRAILRAALPPAPPAAARADDYTLAELQAMPASRRIVLDGQPRSPIQIAYRILSGRWFKRIRVKAHGAWSGETLTHHWPRLNLPAGVSWDRANRAYRVRKHGRSLGYYRFLPAAVEAAARAS